MSVYAFREHIRENVAGEVSGVASRSLGDKTVQLKAQELAVALLHEILDDDNMQDKTGRISSRHKKTTTEVTVQYF